MRVGGTPRVELAADLFPVPCRRSYRAISATSSGPANANRPSRCERAAAISRAVGSDASIRRRPAQFVEVDVGVVNLDEKLTRRERLLY